jgi:hypothetical protein
MIFLLELAECGCDHGVLTPWVSSRRIGEDDLVRHRERERVNEAVFE